MDTQSRDRTTPRVLAALALAMGMAFGSSAALAGEAEVTVGVTILKHTSVQVLSQPASVVVTAEDIARGYVDVPAATHVAVRSNTPQGYLLEFASQGDFMRQIVVRGLDAEVQLTPEGGLVAQRGSASGTTRATLALGYRFMLSSSAQQGTYAWPMRVAALPI